MIRRTCEPRKHWEKIVEEQGLIYHHTKGRPYWNESAFYEFTAAEVDVLEKATNDLQDLFLQTGQYVVDNRRFAEFGIPEIAWERIVWAWKTEPPAIYGRMDLAYDGVSEPKLLEYNADTPTALLEAAVVQWYWLQDKKLVAGDQFSSIHERLITKWKELLNYSPQPLYFAHLDDPEGEDTMTASYMRDTAQQAGWDARGLLMKDIGWDGKTFVDMANEEIRSIFKLYPWEWMVQEEFGKHALDTMEHVNWIEPIWKMIWSNKAILPILWELNPNHPNLLPAYSDGPRDLHEWVKKPKMSREGANIEMSWGPKTGGDYGEEGFIWQQRGPVAINSGKYAVVGSWVIDQISAGIGIRESDGPITDNLSPFVPHLF